MEITQLLIFFADREIFFSYAYFSRDESDTRLTSSRPGKWESEQQSGWTVQICIQFESGYGVVEIKHR